MEIRESIVTTLMSWATLVADECGVPLPSRRVPDLAGFLDAHSGWLAAHPAAADFADEIERLALTAARVIDGDAGFSCTEPGCGERIVLRGGGPPGLRCRAGHLLRVAGPAAGPSGRRVPTQAAALAAGVSEATIRQWARRGRITRYGSKGRAEYDLGELLALRPR